MLNEEQIAADVFAQLKHGFLYVPEKTDFWTVPIESDGWIKGDCEDFALLARQMLKDQGIESRLVLVNDDMRLQDHVIAITEHGWILDNVLHHIATVHNFIGYHFIMQSGFMGDSIWHFIK